MKRKAYESDPIPSQLSHEKYRTGNRDLLYHQNADQIFGKQVSESTWSVQALIDWIDGNQPQTKFKYYLNQLGADTEGYSEDVLNYVYYPTKKIRIPVNKENALKSGLVKEKDADAIVDYIDIELPGVITKKSMMMLDILANNDWKRPIYFSGGSFDDSEFIWMKDYLQLDGLAYKLVPIRTERPNGFEMGRIDTELMYDIVKKWDWGNSGDPDIYLDTQTRIQGVTFRGNLARLMEALVNEGKIEKAKEIIDISITNMPVDQFGYYTLVEPFVDGYYKVGETNKARKLYERLRNIYQERLTYYANTDLDQQYDNIDMIVGDMESYRRNIDVLITNNDREYVDKETKIFNTFIDKFSHFYEDIDESQPPTSNTPELNQARDTTPVSDTIQSVSDSVMADSIEK